MRTLRMMLRSLRLRCPACGEAHLFRPWSFRMPEKCSHCELVLEPEAGFYLGSIYINYGITSLATLLAYFLMRFRFQWANDRILIICLGIALLLPIALFRHARSWWLAMDYVVDRQRRGHQDSETS